jgi:hypothetical protein
MSHRSLLIPLMVLAVLTTSCTAPPPPMDEDLTGINAKQREAYLKEHPYLESATQNAIRDGRILPGFDGELVTLVAAEPSSEGTLQGLYDGIWNYYTSRDTTWVYFKEKKVATVDGTAPLYRFPEIQRKRVVLRFVLPQRQTVVVSLYSAQRKLLAELLRGTLEQGEHELVLKMLEPKNDPIPLRPSGPLRAGRHELRWNARDAEGNPLPDGLYFMRIESTDRNEFLRFSLIQ